MRIVSGEFGKRNLKAVPGRLTRPTTDKVKESLFNMIGPYFDGGRFLDLFAGSGSIGIEAVSRGMAAAVLVDKQAAAIKTIKENVAITKALERFTVYQMDARAALSRLADDGQRFTIVFLDPPYKQAQIERDVASLVAKDLLAPNALVICETDNHTEMAENMAGLPLVRQREYGLTVLSIYRFDVKTGD